MSMRYKGGVISATPPTTSTSSATGIWTLEQQMQAQAASAWPLPPYYYLGYVGTSGTNQGGYACCSDSAGNFYYLGSTTSNINNIVKLNNNGVIQFQVQFSAGLFSAPQRIKVDTSGNIYATFGRYIVKLNSSGAIQWQKRLYGVFAGSFFPGLAIDSSGNVFVCGYDYESSGSFLNGIVAKYNSSGTLQWQKQISYIDSVKGYGCEVDSSGNVYATFAVYDGSGQRPGIIKFNTSGTVIWNIKYQSSSGYQAQTAYSAMSSSDVLSIACDGSGGSNASYIVTINTSTGAVSSQTGLSASSGINLNSISVDSSGNRYCSGTASYYNGSTTLSYGVVAKIGSWKNTFYNSTYFPSLYGVAIDPLSGAVLSAGLDATYNGFISVVPSDGSKTGTYTVNGRSVQYAVGSFIGSASSDFSASGGGLGNSGGSWTDNTPAMTTSTSTLTIATTQM